jgi:hypothetical protein
MNKFITALVTAISVSCYCGSPANSQDMAAYRQQSQPASKAKTRSLKNVLNQLEVKFGVSFIYKSELEQKQLSTGDMEKQASLEATLDYLTSNNELKYKKIRESFYIIYSKDETAPDAQLPRNSSIPALPQPGMAYSAAALQIIIKGQVTDEKGQPIPGATVVVKGTTTGTATDPDGRYTLQAPDGNGVLEFSYLGYVKQEVPISDRTTINVQLTPDIRSMSEVVVVGLRHTEKGEPHGLCYCLIRCRP